MVIADRSEAYQVGGVIEFSYQMYSSQIGDVKTTNRTWTEHYSGNLSGFVYDPRLLLYRASVGYTKNHQERMTDITSLSYNINTKFFGGKPVTWELFASQGKLKVGEGSGERDINITTYGGNMALYLNRLMSRGFRNNSLNNNYNNNGNNNGNNNINNNYGNGYGRGFYIPLPDIVLSYTHQEADSESTLTPIDETRDIMSGSLLYHLGRSTDLEFRSNIDNFENLKNGSKVENRIHSFMLKSTITSNGELKIEGRREESDRLGIPDATGTTTTDLKYENNTLTGDLTFRPANRISHAYHYAYFGQSNSDGSEYTSHAGSGRLMYAVLPELTVHSGLNYGEASYYRPATAILPEEDAVRKTAGLDLGAGYLKTHSPEFLEPFVLHTSYDFSAGLSSLTDSTHENARGRYYENLLTVGLRSAGWKYESAYFDFNYRSKRDHSPLKMNFLSEALSLGLTSTRVPRTSISANAAFAVQRSSSGSAPGVFTGLPPDTSQTGRSTTYTIAIDHTISEYLTLNAGASRGKSTTNTNYTISNLPSVYDQIEERLFAGAVFRYDVSRNLTFRASSRADKRNIEPIVQETTTYQTTAGLDWRIRKLILSSDYRFREEITTNQLRIREQVLFLKVSRPF